MTTTEKALVQFRLAKQALASYKYLLALAAPIIFLRALQADFFELETYIVVYVAITLLGTAIRAFVVGPTTVNIALTEKFINETAGAIIRQPK
ncbi:hypothetical protein [Halioxenophilus sp. WMMB6]|uniref:hypothetical protein n=1 Tax=Halioxenophilus sp. WMMB6 TaxID=3073815 RepID=UPI00295F49DA|nr:hypothetical protein [Halioxenophilus sp. WMMB6]